MRRVQWEAGVGRSVQIKPQAYTSFASSGVGSVDGGNAVGILRSWVGNLEWRRMSKVQDKWKMKIGSGNKEKA
jgi:hypothetical protein